MLSRSVRVLLVMCVSGAVVAAPSMGHAQWLRDWWQQKKAKHHHHAAAGPVLYSPAVCPTVQRVCSYVPQVAYRATVVNVPVTTYRPSTVVDPCTGCVQTAWRPEVTTVRQIQHVPYTCYRQVCTNVTYMPTVAAQPACTTGCGIAAPATVLQPQAAAGLAAPALSGTTTYRPGAIVYDPHSPYGQGVAAYYPGAVATAPGTVYSPGATAAAPGAVYYPNGVYPNGVYPNGVYPNGAYPNGAYPNGGAVPPQSGSSALYYPPLNQQQVPQNGQQTQQYAPQNDPNQQPMPAGSNGNNESSIVRPPMGTNGNGQPAQPMHAPPRTDAIQHRTAGWPASDELVYRPVVWSVPEPGEGGGEPEHQTDLDDGGWQSSRGAR